MDANGSWMGMISSLIKKDMDFAAASFTYTLERSEVVNFLPRMGLETFAIFIKKNAIEELSWRTYFFPFSTDVWFALGFCSIFIFMVHELIIRVNLLIGVRLYSAAGNVFVRYISNYWMLLMSFLAKPPMEYFPNRSISLKVYLFFTFFGGSFVFMCYRASMTSELSITRKLLPFSNIQEFTKTDYR